MVKNISILGSTGSIGTNAISVARDLNLNIVALAAHSNVKLLEEQAREFKPKIVAVFDEKAASVLKNNISDLSTKVVYGIDGICEAATVSDAELVLNSVVGMCGLKPTIEAIKAKKNIALANKETLVAGGEIVMDLAKKNNVKILPVDSEHSAIFQCLQGCNKKEELQKIILTASGGPFFNKSLKDLKNITVEQALNHPNWNMGPKITVDSATMMNKGLEIIEAVWLFEKQPKNIEVIIHRESVIHSLIEYKDHSVIAQLGVPDMKIPIQYAITYPERVKSHVKQLSLTDIKSLTFYKPDYDTFVCLKLCIDAINIGGTLPAMVNGANEEAVKLFLNKKISFLEISEIIKAVIDNNKSKKITSLKDILDADNFARNYVNSII